jgi:hypothetical protein
MKSMLQVVTNKSEISKFQKAFLTEVKKNFTQEIKCYVGFKGGNIEKSVYYSEKLNFWVTNDEFERYWNAFGIGKPKQGSNNIIVGEINFPYEGINRNVAGVFAKDERGKVFVLHRGKIGGGKIGIGKNLFIKHFRGDFETALDGDKETEFCLVGEIDSIHFSKQVANFIKEIQRIKNFNFEDDFSALNDFTYTDEKFGKSVSENNDPKTIERTHGIVVNCLCDELKELGFKVGNDRNRDIFIYRKGKIEVLFEIKTTSSTQSLYSAVGQLLLYSIPIENEVRLIAVLPEKVSKKVEQKFKKLNIEILYYEWNKEKIIFKNLKSVINSVS